jgi:hypothetical protein
MTAQHSNREELHVDTFKAALVGQAKAADLIATDIPDTEHAVDLRISVREDSAYWLKVESVRDEGVGVLGVVNAFGMMPTVKTDAHDILAALWMIQLYATGKVTLYMDDVMHPMGTAETVGRQILIGPSGSPSPVLPEDEATLRWFRDLCDATVAADRLMTASFEDGQADAFATAEPTWVSAVTAITGDDPEDEDVVVHHRLKGALWQHFRSFATRVGVYRLTPGIMEELRDLLHKHEPDMRAVAQAAKEDLEASEHREGLQGRVHLAKAVSRAVDAALGAAETADTIVLQTNSHVFAVGRLNIAEVDWSPGSAGDDEDEEWEEDED